MRYLLILAVCLVAGCAHTGAVGTRYKINRTAIDRALMNHRTGRIIARAMEEEETWKRLTPETRAKLIESGKSTVIRNLHEVYEYLDSAWFGEGME